MTEPLTISVIVPVYNSERTLAETIRSLRDLAYPRDALELIFVNNASTDNTATILARHSHVIRIVNEPKRGRSAARNAGVRAARHTGIAFTDADCIADRDWLRQLVAPLEDPEVGIAGGKILAVRPCNPIAEFGERVHDQAKAIGVYKPPYASTANWASRRSVILETGGFDEDLVRGQDVDLAYRIVQAGYRLVYRERAIIHHRNEQTLRGLFRQGFGHGFHSVKVLKKHCHFVQKFGHRRIRLRRYRILMANAARILSRRADATTVCDTVFNSGKVAGKLLGSLRFHHLDL
jgi:cellulose synthase/poly-beta-1,6-N-acetylglucosamine synthase-like glycosyltransferase